MDEEALKDKLVKAIIENDQEKLVQAWYFLQTFQLHVMAAHVKAALIVALTWRKRREWADRQISEGTTPDNWHKSVQFIECSEAADELYRRSEAAVATYVNGDHAGALSEFESITAELLRLDKLAAPIDEKIEQIEPGVTSEFKH